MTTFQDPPPQSRRSARQNERGEQSVEPTPFGQFPTEPQPFVEQTPLAQPAPTSGRRARPVEPEANETPAEPLNAEPLNYITQGRQPESYETQPLVEGYAPAPQEPTAFRVRDYSPEGGGRRAAVPPLIEPQQPVYGAGASDLEYRTQAGPVAPVPAPVVDPVPHQTMSRRELRERQAVAEATAGVVPESFAVPVNAAPVSAAPVDTALLTQPPQAPQLFTAPPPQQFTAPPPVAPVAPLQAAPTQAAPPPLGPPSTTTAPPVPHTAPPSALSSAMAEFEALTRNGQPPAPNASQRVAEPVAPVVVAPPLESELEQTGGWVAPVGHWSRQADLDDETQPWENTITREVGGGNVATTTSALVLPEIPRASNFSTALDSTGEVLLTGSIDLPPSLSTGGGDSRRYDDPNVDLMFDAQDAEFTGTDSSPVRAIRAVSTHTSSHGVIHANKPHGNRMIVVVFVATAVLAVGVVGLLVASLFLNLF